MSVLLQHCALNATSNSQELIPTPESGAASPTDIGAGLDGEIAEEDAERDSESKMIGVGAANKLMEPKPKIKAKAKAKPAGKPCAKKGGGPKASRKAKASPKSKKSASPKGKKSASPKGKKSASPKVKSSPKSLAKPPKGQRPQDRLGAEEDALSSQA